MQPFKKNCKYSCKNQDDRIEKWKVQKKRCNLEFNTNPHGGKTSNGRRGCNDQAQWSQRTSEPRFSRKILHLLRQLPHSKRRSNLDFPTKKLIVIYSNFPDIPPFLCNYPLNLEKDIYYCYLFRCFLYQLKKKNGVQRDMERCAVSWRDSIWWIGSEILNFGPVWK